MSKKKVHFCGRNGWSRHKSYVYIYICTIIYIYVYMYIYIYILANCSISLIWNLRPPLGDISARSRRGWCYPRILPSFLQMVGKYHGIMAIYSWFTHWISMIFHDFSIVFVCLPEAKSWLVGGFSPYPSEKSWSSSNGMIFHSQLQSHNPFHGSKAPIRWWKMRRYMACTYPH